MTDSRHEGAVDAARNGTAGPDSAGPPPSPWWSRPDDDAWRGPSQPDAGAPAYGDSGQPPYGAYAREPAPTARPEDPWRRPTTRATFPSGASPAPQAWGAPADTLGLADGPRKQRRGLGTAAAVLATALVAGAAGGIVGARNAGGGELLDPSASLGTGSTTAPAVDRAPESVAGIAAKVMRSTVSIAVQGAQGNGTGSGVVIRSDGYVLTNNHVVESAQGGGEIRVTFDDASGRPVPARIVGLDPITDLAVIRVDTDRELPAATLGRSRDLVVGDPVIAIGSPLGLSGTVTTGIVSALNRSPRIPGEGGTSNFLLNAIQTDAAINPGNSGGALVNAAGEVVGINSAIATLGGGGPFGGEAQGGSIGIGFAIPIDEARSVAEEIIRTGRATHPAIGVQATTVSDEQSDRAGALVRELSPGGAAGRAGLQPGDLIVRVEDTEVSSVDELIVAVREHSVGDTITLTYVRDGQTRTAQVTLQDLPRN